MRISCIIDAFFVQSGIYKSTIYIAFLDAVGFNHKLLWCWKKLLSSNRPSLRLLWSFRLFTELIQVLYLICISPLCDQHQTSANCSNIFFVIDQNHNWVLSGISHDLASQINLRQTRISASVIDLASFSRMDKTQDHIYVFMHLNFALKALFASPWANFNYIIYYTHTRDLGVMAKYVLRRAKSILFQSPIELRTVSTNLFPSPPVYYFPVGIDPATFPIVNRETFLATKEFDFVVSIPFIQKSDNPHYYHRKNIAFLEKVIFILSLMGFSALVIGSDWNDSAWLSASTNVELIDVSYAKKYMHYRRCRFFLNLSLLEGGPVTMLEAALSGCSIISTNTGIFEHLGSIMHTQSFQILSTNVSAQETSELIASILVNHQDYTYSEYLGIYKSITDQFGFGILASSLLQHISNSEA